MAPALPRDAEAYRGRSKSGQGLLLTLPLVYTEDALDLCDVLGSYVPGGEGEAGRGEQDTRADREA